MMATTGCSPATFFGICKNAFYFEMAETDMDKDDFQLGNECSTYKLQSNEDKFLLLNAEGQFQVKQLTMEEQSQPECQFNIHCYNNSDSTRERRRAVMLYANKDGKKVMVCCGDKKEIYPMVTMDLPPSIDRTDHEALFYMIELSTSHKYIFESSAYPSQYLRFERDKHNSSLHKLVLHYRAPDTLDESLEVSLVDD